MTTNQESVHLILREEAWTADDDNPQFAFVVYVWKKDGEYYHYRQTHRGGSAEFHQGVHIPHQYYMPLPQPGLTRVQKDIPTNDIYIKVPALVEFDSDYKQPVAVNVLHEAQVCEGILVSPHPNVCRYLGYQESADGRISGLCFDRHNKDLRTAVRDKDVLDIPRILDGIMAGVTHLHSLKLVHNDINADNVVLDKSGDAVIIDFDSCWEIGTNLHGKKVGTLAETSQPENDILAIESLRTWLFRKANEVLQGDFEGSHCCSNVSLE